MYIQPPPHQQQTKNENFFFKKALYDIFSNRPCMFAILFIIITVNFKALKIQNEI